MLPYAKKRDSFHDAATFAAFSLCKTHRRWRPKRAVIRARQALSVKGQRGVPRALRRYAVLPCNNANSDSRVVPLRNFTTSDKNIICRRQYKMRRQACFEPNGKICANAVIESSFGSVRCDKTVKISKVAQAFISKSGQNEAALSRIAGCACLPK